MNINFGANKQVSFTPQIHSYTELMRKRSSEYVHFQNMTDLNESDNVCIQNNNISKSIKSDNEKTGTEEENMTQTSEENISPLLRVVDRDKAKNFTEYVFSRPVTFAHKCEDFMAATSTLAIFAGMGAIGAIYNPDIIPSHEKVALGFIGVAGVCLLGTLLSGVAGGVSDYVADKKKKMMQDKLSHTRD